MRMITITNNEGSAVSTGMDAKPTIGAEVPELRYVRQALVTQYPNPEELPTAPDVDRVRLETVTGGADPVRKTAVGATSNFARAALIASPVASYGNSNRTTFLLFPKKDSRPDTEGTKIDEAADSIEFLTYFISEDLAEMYSRDKPSWTKITMEDSVDCMWFERTSADLMVTPACTLEESLNMLASLDQPKRGTPFPATVGTNNAEATTNKDANIVGVIYL